MILEPVKNAAADLPPAYFSLVMATGIVSIASHLLGFVTIAFALLWLNILFYLLLWMLTCLRIVFFPRRLLADLGNHNLSVGFFTLVAGTCVLGSQFVILLKAFQWAFLLLGLGMALWIFFTYTVFVLLTVTAVKPPLEEGINGLWLVAVVATQSVSILSGLLAPSFPVNRELVLFFSFAMFLLGGMLYLLIITLIFYRFMFFTLKPEDLGPPYWINMGAVAISTLAGATLVLGSAGSPLLERLVNYNLGFAFFFWVTATWWIPFLLLLGAWRYLIRREPFTYDPQYWGMVFPLGMYTACTLQLSKAAGMDSLAVIPKYFIYAALLAWALTFLGMMNRLVRALFGSTQDR